MTWLIELVVAGQRVRIPAAVVTVLLAWAVGGTLVEVPCGERPAAVMLAALLRPFDW